MIMKKSWKDRKGVSPVIATILMVAITVVLAAVLYVMVMGFGGEENQTPTVALGSRAVSGGYEVYVISVSGGEIAIGNVEAIVVSGGGEDVEAGTVTSVGSNPNLSAGDKSLITDFTAGSITVMFRDKANGASLGQTTFNAVVA